MGGDRCLALTAAEEDLEEGLYMLVWESYDWWG